MMSASKKINHNSNLILINKLYEQLTHFEDENIVNIETSIPVLHATKILQVIESI
jgi:CMP-2-keto-3-deoxyoctulosonic acid synthetase